MTSPHLVRQLCNPHKNKPKARSVSSADTKPVVNSPPHNHMGPPMRAPTTRPRPVAATVDETIVARALGKTSVVNETPVTMVNSKTRKMANKPAKA